MNDLSWKDEFNYLLNRKILSRDELGYLLSQIESIIKRETEEINRQRNIEQGGWEEVKKYQDEVVRLKNAFLTLEEMKDIMRDYIDNNEDWNYDGLVDRIYEAQEERIYGVQEGDEKNEMS